MGAGFIGVVLSLIAAFSWGGGDFCGGYATRRVNQFQVLFLSTLSSMALVFLCALLWGEQLPSLRNVLLAFLAGISGALGLAALYRGLSIGNSALVASVAGVIGAVFPMFVGMLIEGLPGYFQMVGFVLALIGIWLVTKFGHASNKRADGSLVLAILAGFGFGGFLTLVAQFDGEQIFAPLVVAKIAALILAIFILRGKGLAIPGISVSPVALLSGVLDAGGNIFYLFAAQWARLDIVAVLSSLYPAVTVLLSSLLLREQVTPQQWGGVAACVTAIILIAI
jgi:drug/metabolite transporter (DMT)-like permease